VVDGWGGGGGGGGGGRGAEGVLGWGGSLSPNPGLLMTATRCEPQYSAAEVSSFLPPRFEFRTGQPEASFCTNNAIPTSDHHIDYVFCQTLVTLRVNKTLTFSFSAVGYLLMLYLTLVTTSVDFVSFMRHSVSTADAKQLERIQW
jgi:hypothetical protein